MAIVLKDIVQVSTAGQATPIRLRPDLFWKGPGDPGLTYDKLLKGRSEINRLLGQPLRSKGKDKRKLQYASIIETLTQLRNDRIKSMVEESESKEQKIDFDIDESEQSVVAGRLHGKKSHGSQLHYLRLSRSTVLRLAIRSLLK